MGSTGNVEDMPCLLSQAITRQPTSIVNWCPAQAWGTTQMPGWEKMLRAYGRPAPTTQLLSWHCSRGGQYRACPWASSLFSSLLSTGVFELGSRKLDQKIFQKLATASFPGNWFMGSARRINRTLSDLKGHSTFKRTARQVAVKSSSTRDGLASSASGWGWVKDVISRPGFRNTLLICPCL